jgi:hypothetical protein
VSLVDWGFTLNKRNTIPKAALKNCSNDERSGFDLNAYIRDNPHDKKYQPANQKQPPRTTPSTAVPQPPKSRPARKPKKPKPNKNKKKTKTRSNRRSK